MLRGFLFEVGPEINSFAPFGLAYQYLLVINPGKIYPG
jgi:hypothetical protein